MAAQTTFADDGNPTVLCTGRASHKLRHCAYTGTLYDGRRFVCQKCERVTYRQNVWRKLWVGQL